VPRLAAKKLVATSLMPVIHTGRVIHAFFEPREKAIHGPLILLEGRDRYTSLIPIAEATPVAARAEA
jgi:hypothetical protein